MPTPSGQARLIALLKGELPRVVNAGSWGSQQLEHHPPVTEEEVVTSVTAGPGINVDQSRGNLTIEATGGAGGIQLSEVLADDYQTSVDTTLTTADTCALFGAYRAYTTFGGSKYSESGTFVVYITGAGTALTQWNRVIGEAGAPLLDDTGISGNVVAGAIKLDVTTNALGATCQFNAIVLAVEAP